jgi:hypothetical protein
VRLNNIPKQGITMKKLLASLLFAVPALSMSLYGATLESPKGASHHRHHHHHDCSSSSSSSTSEVTPDSQFAFFYLDEEQFLDNGDEVIWDAFNGTHTDGIFVDQTAAPTTDIIIAERGIYLVTWVLTVATDPTISDNGAVQFQLELNGNDIAGGVYATTIVEPDSESFKAGQLFGQTVITVVNTNSRLSLANDSDKTVELVSNLLYAEDEEVSESEFNISASIFIQKLSDFCVR